MKKWNYNPPAKSIVFDYQKDWNQTIVVIFNILAGGTDIKENIKVPVKFKPLIESLLFYNKETSKIDDRFNVEFIESEDDTILVGDEKLEIENFS